MMVIQPGGTSVGGEAPSGASSAAVAIPPLSNGANPKWVHVAAMGNNGHMVIRFGTATVVAASKTNGICVHANASSLIINVAGNTHYKTYGVGAAVDFSMTPLAGINQGG